MRFTKMEGLGNDFVVVDSDVELDSDRVRRLCDRHFGVGADGVLRVGVRDGDVVMDYWNADGGVAEMCGNGLRCVAMYALENGLVSERDFIVVTAAGRRRVTASERPRVELGPVILGESFSWAGSTFYPVTVGNPHAVTMVDDPEKIDVAGIGSELERATPGGVNVGFFAAEPEALRLRVWERGVGETLACGSGMVAATAVACHFGLADGKVTVRVAGGESTVEFSGETSWLTGPARIVFVGEVEL